MNPSHLEIESVIAEEAAAHARAAEELNPFGDSEALELGSARLVYSGQWSPVHGCFALGLDGPVEARDFHEVERFFLKKERRSAYWICPGTDSSLLSFLDRDFHAAKKTAVSGAEPRDLPLPAPAGESRPDFPSWALAFTKTLDPAAKEVGLFALTKLHQKETSYYLGKEPGAASYTFFRNGIAFIPFPSTPELLALQIHDSANFRCRYVVVLGKSPLTFLYERTLYERI